MRLGCRLEQQRERGAGLNRPGCVAGGFARNGLGIDDRVAPLVELDPLGQQLRAQPVAFAGDRVTRTRFTVRPPGSAGPAAWPRSGLEDGARPRVRTPRARSSRRPRHRRDGGRPHGREPGRSSVRAVSARRACPEPPAVATSGRSRRARRRRGRTGRGSNSLVFAIHKGSFHRLARGDWHPRPRVPAAPPRLAIADWVRGKQEAVGGRVRRQAVVASLLAGGGVALVTCRSSRTGTGSDSYFPRGGRPLRR